MLFLHCKWPDFCITYQRSNGNVTDHPNIPFLFQCRFEVEAVSNGNEAAITPGFEGRAILFLKLQFGIILLFWSCLWTVKFSFLFFLRRMFAGTYGIMIYWWGAFTFVLLAYLGCWVTRKSVRANYPSLCTYGIRTYVL